jgi:hypothetical protein
MLVCRAWVWLIDDSLPPGAGPGASRPAAAEIAAKPPRAFAAFYDFAGVLVPDC